MKFGLLLAGFLAAATPALSQNVGILIGNEDYVALPDVRRGDRMVNGATALGNAGVEMITRRDANLDEMLFLLSEFGQMATEAEVLIIGLSGRFVHTSNETYFLPTDAEAGPLAMLANRSLPLSTVFAWLESRPQKALLMLSTDGARNEYSPFIRSGIGELDIPG